MSNLKTKGVLPEDHQSFDSFNETASVSVDDTIITDWKVRSEQLCSEHLEKYGENLVWAVIDGFLLYWDEVDLKMHCSSGNSRLCSVLSRTLTCACLFVYQKMSPELHVRHASTTLLVSRSHLIEFLRRSAQNRG
jgi:hypothetical protein